MFLLKLLKPQATTSENTPKMMGSWLWVVLLEQEDWTRWPPEIPSSLNRLVILWSWE